MTRLLNRWTYEWMGRLWIADWMERERMGWMDRWMDYGQPVGQRDGMHWMDGWMDG